MKQAIQIKGMVRGRLYRLKVWYEIGDTGLRYDMRQATQGKGMI